jgi:hypothetical protein
MFDDPRHAASHLGDDEFLGFVTLGIEIFPEGGTIFFDELEGAKILFLDAFEIRCFHVGQEEALAVDRGGIATLEEFLAVTPPMCARGPDGETGQFIEPAGVLKRLGASRIVLAGTPEDLGLIENQEPPAVAVVTKVRLPEIQS